MHKEEFLKQLLDSLRNDKDVKKVKVTYKNGESMKLDFDNDDDYDDDYYYDDDDYADDDNEDDNEVVKGETHDEPEVVINTGTKVTCRGNVPAYDGTKVMINNANHLMQRNVNVINS